MSSHMQKWPYFIPLAVIKCPCALIFWNPVLSFWMWKRQCCRRCGEGGGWGEKKCYYTVMEENNNQYKVVLTAGLCSIFFTGVTSWSWKSRDESDVALRTTVLKAVIHQLLLYHWAAWTLWLKPSKMCPYRYHWRECENIHFEQISAMERREALLSALSQLRLAHPALPQLRDFQVNLGSFHTKTHQTAHNVIKIFFSGTYWRMPWIKMIQTTSSVLCLLDLAKRFRCFCLVTSCLQVLEVKSWNPKPFIHITCSITMILVPLITIEQQLLDDCKKLGLTAIAGSQVKPWTFSPISTKNWCFISL